MTFPCLATTGSGCLVASERNPFSSKPNASLSKTSSPDTYSHNSKSGEDYIFWETNQILAVGKLRNPRKPFDIFPEPARGCHQVPWVMLKLLHLMDSPCFTSSPTACERGDQNDIWPDLMTYHSFGVGHFFATAKNCYPKKGWISHKIMEL